MKGDRVTVATQNTRCLGQGFAGRRKRKELKDLFKNTTPTTNILLLQATKIAESACLKQAKLVEFRGGSSLWNEATFSARTTRFKGGTCMVFSERMATTITSHGILYPGRAQYAIFQIKSRLKLGVLNIYRFSHIGPRAMLWNHLAQTAFPEAVWILVGNFNNIEHANDKQGGSSKVNISRREMDAWNRLLLHLGVRDAFRTQAYHKRLDKAFTWTNAHQDEMMIQSCIDRIYISTHIEDIGGTIEILLTLPNLSDHVGVVLHFDDEPRRKPRTPSFNKGLLTNPETITLLLETWKTVMHDATLKSWNHKIVAANHAINLKLVELTKSQKQK